MTQFDENLANKKLIEIAKKYNLKPSLLKDILVLRNRGMNNAEIANHTGINRNTVNKYVNALNEMDKQDLDALIALIVIIGAGAVVIGLLEALFGSDR